MSKQDRQGVRTATDLEQKYNFGKTFAELMGVATDARESVDSLASVLRDEVDERASSIARSVSEIKLTVESDYSLKSELDEYKKSAETTFVQTDSEIIIGIESSIEGVQEGVGAINEKLQKHFEFGDTGLIIKAGIEGDDEGDDGTGDTTVPQNAILRLDNGIIAFYVGEFVPDDPEINRRSWWDKDNFNVGNIVVNLDERAQFGNFAFIPREGGSLDFLKVGGE
jgi:hypothetical protein